MIAKPEHWNLSKVAKLAVCQLIAMAVCLFVTLYHSPTSETLLQVNRERLLFYATFFGVFFLLAGEVSGLFVDQRKSRSWKRIFLAMVSSGLAVLALIILVWTIEFDFVGRFAALKMLGGLGLLAYIFLSLLGSLLLALKFPEYLFECLVFVKKPDLIYFLNSGTWIFTLNLVF